MITPPIRIPTFIRAMNDETKDMIALMRLLQFTDSAFPVGTFSFSNGLETAAYEGIVRDAATLEAYTEDIARQAAYTDGIVALQAFRAARRKDYEAVAEADRQLMLCKMNAEARQMLQRMGKKLAELGVQIFADSLFPTWLKEICDGRTPGTYPVAQALAFSAAGLSEKELFCSHQYGVISMILSAALRCVKVSHYDTQRILFTLGKQAPEIYEEIRELTYEDINAFVPQIDILASLHEKGTMRMFMN